MTWCCFCSKNPRAKWSKELLFPCEQIVHLGAGGQVAGMAEVQFSLQDGLAHRVLATQPHVASLRRIAVSRQGLVGGWWYRHANVLQ